MRILVTGGAGFIGSHVVDAACAAGHEVSVLDDLSTGRRENVSKGVRLEVVDLRDRERVFRTLSELRPDAICHEAAQPSVAISMREPLLDAESNVIGSINLLDACVANDIERFVFASSGGTVYGEVPEGERASETAHVAPKSPYGIGKLHVEQLLGVYFEMHELDSTILRYANVYGPRQNPHGECGVVATFIERAFGQLPITILARQKLGDDGCVRDYACVADVARVTVLALEAKLEPRLLNVGTGVGTSTREIAESVFGASGRRSPIEFGPPRPGDLKRNVLDPSLCERALGGMTSLKAGLELTLKLAR